MNYGEELAYWYFRLNGFFPISNFVIHRTEDIAHSSDCDVLGIRMPNVFEPIGGHEDDWDEYLFEYINPDYTIGLISEVKTGKYSVEKIFNPQNIRYSVERIGILLLEDDQYKEFEENDILSIEDEEVQFVKILIAPQDPENEKYIYLSIDHIQDFIVERINKYPEEKWRDRMFFHSNLFQLLINNTTREDRKA